MEGAAKKYRSALFLATIGCAVLNARSGDTEEAVAEEQARGDASNRVVGRLIDWLGPPCPARSGNPRQTRIAVQCIFCTPPLAAGSLVQNIPATPTAP